MTGAMKPETSDLEIFVPLIGHRVGSVASWYRAMKIGLERRDVFGDGGKLDTLPDLVVNWSSASAATQARMVSPEFGSVDWPINDSLTLTTGLRYTDEEIDFAGGTTDLNPFDASCILDPFCGSTGPSPARRARICTTNRNTSTTRKRVG